MTAKNTFDPNGASVCDGIFGLPFEPEDARVVLVPVPFDATASYHRGASGGPQLIREASWQVDLWDAETGDPWSAGIAMLDVDPRIVDLNSEACELSDRITTMDDVDLRYDIDRINAIGDEMTGWVYEEARKWVGLGKLVGVVGGEHSVPLGAIVAIAEQNPGLGVLHIDAHADLRDAYQGMVQSHASIMRNVLNRATGVSRITQVGLRDLCAAERDVIRGNDRISAFFDHDMARRQFDGESFRTIARDIVATLPMVVYISFDIDGLDPSLCPGTGTPVPGGLSFQQASFLLAEVVKSGRKIVGFDLCEVASRENGDIDGIVGARVLFKLIGWALMSCSA
ncbi:MAG: agmatinase family protein [Polyangiaceae bacterium]|nr:agmatinase family protein [Polyangiaceae bacterium]